MPPRHNDLPSSLLTNKLLLTIRDFRPWEKSSIDWFSIITPLNFSPPLLISAKYLRYEQGGYPSFIWLPPRGCCDDIDETFGGFCQSMVSPYLLALLQYISGGSERRALTRNVTLYLWFKNGLRDLQNWIRGTWFCCVFRDGSLRDLSFSV